MEATEIRKAHCLFEQSGTFKNEFIKLGIPAEDYDIQNNFGQTDHVIDLFAEIEKAYEQRATSNEQASSIFDTMSTDDLIIAFFPCIYFCDFAQMVFSLNNKNFEKMSNAEKFRRMLIQADNRNDYFKLLMKLVAVALERNLKLIFENPWGSMSYLKTSFLKPPSIIDHDRTERGDYFRKPTAYWFWNFEPTHGYSYQKLHEARSVKKTAKPAAHSGLCSEERSMIAPDYARNFICDFILGKRQPELEQGTLFEELA